MHDLQFSTDILKRLRAEEGRYDERAFLFVLAAIEFLQSRLEARRHVTGPELSWACRDFAVRQFGLLAPAGAELLGGPAYRGPRADRLHTGAIRAALHPACRSGRGLRRRLRFRLGVQRTVPLGRGSCPLRRRHVGGPGVGGRPPSAIRLPQYPRAGIRPRRRRRRRMANHRHPPRLRNYLPPMLLPVLSPEQAAEWDRRAEAGGDCARDPDGCGGPGRGQRDRGAISRSARWRRAGDSRPRQQRRRRLGHRAGAAPARRSGLRGPRGGGRIAPQPRNGGARQRGGGARWWSPTGRGRR